MDQIKSQVDNLAELSDEQVATLQEAIVSEFESYESQEPTVESVDAMTTLADMLDTVKGETQRREAAMEELASRAAEAAMRVKGEEVQEDDMVEEPVEPVEEMPSEDMPMEMPGEMPEMPEEETGYMPVEEDEEKKKKDMKSYSATESADASINTVKGSEFTSDEPEIPAEEVAEEATTEASVDGAVELSSDP